MRKMKFKVPEVKKMQFPGNDLKFEFPAGLVELTAEETKSIVAGEGLSYWIGYVAGKIGNLFS